MKKRTILVALLSLVCLVCGAIGLAACGGEEEVVIKVGDNKISKVEHEAKEYKIEGEAGKTYTLTAKVDGEQNDHILLWIAPGAYAYGSVEFEYIEDTTVKISANVPVEGSDVIDESATVENVVITMAEKVTPPPAAGEAANPISLVNGTAANYSVGYDYVFYKLSGITETRFYVFTVTGDDKDYLDIAVGASLNADGDDIDEEVTPNDGKYALAANTEYYVRVASSKLDSATGNYATITGTVKVEQYVNPQPVDKGTLTAGSDITVDSLDKLGVTVTVELKQNKSYTITASKGGEACADVYIFMFAGVRDYGTVAFDWDEADYTVTVTITAAGDNAVTDVTLSLTEEDIAGGSFEDYRDDITEITLGNKVTVTSSDMTFGDENYGSLYAVYKLKVTAAGRYKVVFDNAQFDSGWNFAVGNVIDEDDEVDGSINGNLATFEVDEETGVISYSYQDAETYQYVSSETLPVGIYYLVVYSEVGFTVSAAD